ncbi:MAG: hypothetical protein ACE14T_02545 [Syntrophales bacterium]
MEKELLLKYGGYGQTTIHPLIIGIVFAVAVLIFIVPRRYVIIPFILAVVLIPMYQEIVVAGINLFVLRILLFVGWLRVLVRQEMRPIGWNRMDSIVTALAVSSIVTFTIMWGTWGAFVNRLGMAYDLIGSYFLIRCLLVDFTDVERVVRILALISIPIAILMLIEYLTGRNPLVFLGAPEIAGIREGRFRSQGPFANPILAGTYGATVFPLAVSLWWAEGRRRKTLAVTSALAATMIVWTSSSSGPVFTYLAAAAGLLMWRFRYYMRPVRWGILFALIGLHLVMKAPVWALIGRLQAFGTSMSYHRYVLIDQFINRFNEWWLIGTKFTSDWAFGMWDITNQYILFGINGGLVTLLLFVFLIAASFQAVGRAVRHTAHISLSQKLLWAIGVALFAHTIAFIGISYFDQILLIWYILIGMVSLISNLDFSMHSAAYEAVVR